MCLAKFVSWSFRVQSANYASPPETLEPPECGFPQILLITQAKFSEANEAEHLLAFSGFFNTRACGNLSSGTVERDVLRLGCWYESGRKSPFLFVEGVASFLKSASRSQRLLTMSAPFAWGGAWIIN